MYRQQLSFRLDTANEARVYDIDLSIAIAKEVLEHCKEANLNDIAAKALSQLSLYCMIVGRNEEALQYAKESIALYEELNDDKGIADAKYSIASVYYKTNNYHIGLVFLIDALNIYKHYNDYYNISRCEKSLGTVYEYSGDQNNAVLSYENAIRAAKSIKDLNLESNAYNNLSGIYIKQGKIEIANKIIEKSIFLKRQKGDVRGLAFALYGKAKVLLAKKEYDESIKLFNESIAIHSEMGERLGLAMCYHKLARLYLEIKELSAAKKVLNKAIIITKKYNIILIRFKCFYMLYTIYKIEKKHTMALKYLERYLNEKENVINTQTLKVIDSYDMLVQMKTMQKEAKLQKEKAEIIEKSSRSEESARVRQEFLSTMSHEIRTPLNAITTIVSMLGEKYDNEDKKLINSLKFSSNLLMWILNDILDFTKLDLGKMKLELYPVKIQQLLENICKSYKYQAREKGLKFTMKSSISLTEAYYIDETRITQILGNLISNAIKFTEHGSITMHIEQVKKGPKYDLVVFKVSDTGEGIEDKYLAKIFESFSQIKDTITRKKGGTGLGLAIVKSLVKLHGSAIQVKSESGKGTDFWFELKLKKAHVEVKAKPVSFQNCLEGKTVLLAEDNNINAFIAKTLLSKWGIITDHAVDGLEAVDKANQKQYDFILMDIHMPEMDGFEATQIVRTTNSMNKNTPIYGLTADISAKDNPKYQSYFTGFLFKPLQIEKLHLALSGIKG